MKRITRVNPAGILCLLCISFFSVQASGQYQKGMYRLKYSNSGGEQGLTSYIYNGKDLPYKAIWELDDGSRWSLNYHEFDEKGNLITKYREFSDSLTTKQEYSYDDQNNLISETYSRSDGILGIVEYHYNEGRLVNAVCNGLNGWFYGTIEYIYAEGNKPVSAELVSQGEVIGRISYKYKSDGRLYHEMWSFYNGFSQALVYDYMDSDKVVYRSSNVFIKNNHPWRIKEESYDYSNQNGGPSYYEYDSGNKLVQKTFVRSDSLKTVTDYEYNEKGLLIKSTRHYSDGKTGVFNYSYNQNGNLIFRGFQRSDNFQGLERYRYDEHGKLITGIYENFDGWLSGTLEFEHDRYDRIINADYKGNDGLDARITFKYDRYGNLRKVHWNFSNGASQTYIFTYETQNSDG